MVAKRSAAGRRGTDALILKNVAEIPLLTGKGFYLAGKACVSDTKCKWRSSVGLCVEPTVSTLF